MDWGKKTVDVIIAEDNDEDFKIFMDSVQEGGIPNRFQRAADGAELLHYLRQPETSTHPHFRPGLVILDWCMPKVSGPEAVQALKSDPDLKKIPVVVLSDSNRADDVKESYDLGVASFVRKPATFMGYVELIKSLNKYWFNVVKLPHVE